MMRWRVVCAFAVIMDSFSPISAFMRDDLPTLGFPTILTKPDLKDSVHSDLQRYSLFFTWARPTFANPLTILEPKRVIEREGLYRGVEQLVARWAHNPKVIGSSPVPATERKRLIRSLFSLYAITFIYFGQHALR